MQFEKMTDYELVKGIQKYKTNCTMKGKYLGALYNRYKPQIHKHSHQLFRKFPNKKETHIEDYFQDAYFAVLKAAESFSEEKVNFSDKSKWKFVQLLWFCLKKQNRRYRRYFYHVEAKESPYLRTIEEDGDLQRYEMKSVDGSYYIPLEEQFSDEIKNLFSQLTDVERKSIELRWKGHNLQVIGDMLGKKHSTIHYALKRAREKANVVF